MHFQHKARVFRKWPDTIQEVLQAFAKGENSSSSPMTTTGRRGDLIVRGFALHGGEDGVIIRHTSGIVLRADHRRRRRGCGSIRWWRTRVQSPTGVYGLDRLQADGGTGISADERASCCRALAIERPAPMILPARSQSFR